VARYITKFCQLLVCHTIRPGLTTPGPLHLIAHLADLEMCLPR
jgi:hypothetical protein